MSRRVPSVNRAPDWQSRLGGCSLLPPRGRIMSNQPAASEKAVTLFLSYARADEAQAKRLAAALEHAGFTIWWDALIEGGAAFGQSIARALETADAIIVL